RCAAALAPAPRRGGDPAVPPGVHPGPPAPPVHGVRDPRADPGGRGPRDHIVGVVESPQRVPARRAASQAGRPGVRLRGALLQQRRRSLVVPRLYAEANHALTLCPAEPILQDGNSDIENTIFRTLPDRRRSATPPRRVIPSVPAPARGATRLCIPRSPKPRPWTCWRDTVAHAPSVEGSW